MTAGTEIDAAVIGTLQADATLAGLAKGGVFPNVAPEGAAEKGVYVIVQLQAHEDVDEQQTADAAYEEPRYLAKAVGRGTDSTAVAAAYARIHTLLQGAALAITGYRCIDTRREGRVAFAEQDGAFYWQHMGGIYRVQAEAL